MSRMLWLNNWLDQDGVWHQGDNIDLVVTESVTVNAQYVVFHEVAHSGSVLLAPSGSSLESCGDPEVYLNVHFQDGSQRYYSAPLHTTFQVFGVSSFDLSIIVMVGNAACSEVQYHANVNSHCIYELPSIQWPLSLFRSASS